MSLKQGIKTFLERRGYTLSRTATDLGEEFIALHRRVRTETMTSLERQYALHEAVRYVARSGLKGAIVECGVWRGGSAMLAALTLSAMGDVSRKLYLYDTFSGMSEPTALDVSVQGGKAEERWRTLLRGSYNEWDYAPLDVVESNMRSTGYPVENVIYVKGKIEDTVPGTIPDEIALLRLDTDWYESTKHELEHLYPRLVRGGVLIIDDYGHWKGARTAVDEYFSKHGPVLLNRIDYTGRIGVKAV